MSLFHVSANESEYVRILVYPCADSGLTDIMDFVQGHDARIMIQGGDAMGKEVEKASRKGVIYVLKNPSFPEYVKIGYADDLEKRLHQFNNSACLPFAFRVYCVYEVDGRLKDRDVHKLIDKLNPDLRAIETFDGKPRVREFYNITAEDAYEILYSIASISGTTSRLKKMKPEGHEAIDEALAMDIQDSGAVSYSEDYHIQKGGAAVRELYYSLKERIMALDDGIFIEPKKLYIAFKAKSNICEAEIQKAKIKITINLRKGKLYDPENLAKDVSETGHWGNGDYMVSLYDEETLDYTVDLIRQAYDCSRLQA